MESAIKDKGFTLIELAVVLVVIGILITLGVSLIGPLTKRVKINQTNDIIDAASESLISYASSNKRLPTTTEFTSAVRNPNDAWTKSLFYVTDSNLTTITSPAVEAVCGRSTTNLTVQTCPDPATKKLFEDLADVELGHEHLLEERYRNMKEGLSSPS